MSIKSALIVDDSKTAQFKLKKILDIYELKVDLAISAEDALSYLAYQLPDIIFMDHSMKGMNGLEAVKIIKANPSTATIPVVMYTAEKGDVYLSQARAIGALDVISKDVMAKSDIQRVMKSVNIKLIPKSPSLSNETLVELTDGSDEVVSNELIQIREQVSQSMRIQQGHISRDIQDNTRLMTRRFLHELRNVQVELKQTQKQQSQLATAIASVPKQPKRPSALWGIIPFILLLSGIIYSALEISQLKKNSDSTRGIYKEIAQQQADQNEIVLASLNKLERRGLNQPAMSSEELLAAFVWAINQNGRYKFAEQALGDDRIGLVSGLINVLDQARFKGTLTLGVHAGNFCVITASNGQLALPKLDDTTSLSDGCILLSTYGQDFSTAAQTSASFSNFLNSSPAVESGRLKVDIRSHGIYSPSYEYPAYSVENSYDTSITHDWNLVAAANNRLTVTLTPE